MSDSRDLQTNTDNPAQSHLSALASQKNDDLLFQGGKAAVVPFVILQRHNFQTCICRETLSRKESRSWSEGCIKEGYVSMVPYKAVLLRWCLVLCWWRQCHHRSNKRKCDPSTTQTKPREYPKWQTWQTLHQMSINEKNQWECLMGYCEEQLSHALLGQGYTYRRH